MRLTTWWSPLSHLTIGTLHGQHSITVWCRHSLIGSFQNAKCLTISKYPTSLILMPNPTPQIPQFLMGVLWASYTFSMETLEIFINPKHHGLSMLGSLHVLKYLLWHQFPMVFLGYGLHISMDFYPSSSSSSSDLMMDLYSRLLLLTLESSLYSWNPFKWTISATFSSNNYLHN